jgi:6-phosphogluconolactonase
MDPSLLIFDTAGAAAHACGDRILDLLEQARKERGQARKGRGQASIAFSGGNTPRLMFQAMAKRRFDWRGIEIFQVDERCVPPDNALSNFRMMRESLLDAVGIEEGQVHRIRGEMISEAAARLYADDIRGSFHLNPAELPVFDVIARGMGPDGHTASLFPGEPLIGDLGGIASAVFVESQKSAPHRITLLRGVLERARHTLCLAAGEDKAEAMRSVLRGSFDPLRTPAQIASPDTVWYVDKSAAALL